MDSGSTVSEEKVRLLRPLAQNSSNGILLATKAEPKENLNRLISRG
jgi:hypothetical protein